MSTKTTTSTVPGKTTSTKKTTNPALERLKTSNDAVISYLREEITEKELRKFISVMGSPVGDSIKGLDEAYARKIPKDLLGESELDYLEIHKRAIAEKKAIRAEATRLASKDKSEKDTIARESNPEFSNKLTAKYITDPLGN